LYISKETFSTIKNILINGIKVLQGTIDAIKEALVLRVYDVMLFLKVLTKLKPED